jgi:hypothetical protein
VICPSGAAQVLPVSPADDQSSQNKDTCRNAWYGDRKSFVSPLLPQTSSALCRARHTGHLLTTPAHFLRAAQEMSESQILNASPPPKDFRQGTVKICNKYDFQRAQAWHEA